MPLLLLALQFMLVKEGLMTAALLLAVEDGAGADELTATRQIELLELEVAVGVRGGVSWNELSVDGKG